MLYLVLYLKSQIFEQVLVLTKFLLKKERKQLKIICERHFMDFFLYVIL